MAKEPVIEFPEIEDDRLAARDGATETVAVVIPDAADATGDATSVDDAVADLQRQLDASRTENARLANERAAAQQEANAARGETRDSNLAAVTNSIELTTQQLNQNEAALAAALEAADFKTVAKIQREISRNENKLAQLENGRLVLEQRLQGGHRPIVTEGRVQAPQPQQRQPVTLDEKVEDLARRVTPASADWLRAHKAALNNPKALAAAHDHAVNVRGLTQDTPAYFAAIEADLGFAQQPQQRQNGQRRPPTVSAPANREAVSMVNGRPQGSRVINLTARQQDMAKAMDMTNEEYAKYLYEDQVARGVAN